MTFSALLLGCVLVHAGLSLRLPVFFLWLQLRWIKYPGAGGSSLTTGVCGLYRVARAVDPVSCSTVPSLPELFQLAGPMGPQCLWELSQAVPFSTHIPALIHMRPVKMPMIPHSFLLLA